MVSIKRTRNSIIDTDVDKNNITNLLINHITACAQISYLLPSVHLVFDPDHAQCGREVRHLCKDGAAARLDQLQG